MTVKRVRRRELGAPLRIEGDLTETQMDAESPQNRRVPASRAICLFTPWPEEGINRYTLIVSGPTHKDGLFRYLRLLGKLDKRGNRVGDPQALDEFTSGLVTSHYVPIVTRGWQEVGLRGRLLHDEIEFVVRVDYPTTPWQDGLKVLAAAQIPIDKITVAGPAESQIMGELRKRRMLHLLNPVARTPEEKIDYIQKSVASTPLGTRVYYSAAGGTRFLTCGTIGDMYSVLHSKVESGDLRNADRVLVLKRLEEVERMLSSKNPAGARELSLFGVGNGYRPQELSKAVGAFRQRGQTPDYYRQAFHEFHLHVVNNTPSEFQADSPNNPAWVDTMYKTLRHMVSPSTPVELYTTWLNPQDPEFRRMVRLLQPLFPERIIQVGRREQPVTKRVLTGGRRVWLADVEGLQNPKFIRETRYTPEYITSIFRVITNRDGRTECVGADRIRDPETLEAWKKSATVTSKMARQIASEYIRWNTNRKEALTLMYGVLSDPEIMMNAHHVPGTSFFIRDFRPDLFPLDSMSREKHKDKDLLSQVVAKMATLVAVNMAAGSFTVGTGDELIGYTPVRILQTDPTSCFWTDRVSKPMDADPSHYLMASMVLAKTRLLAGIMGMPQKDRDEIRDIYIAGLANSLRGLGSYALAHPHWWDHFGETPGARENLTGSRWDMRVQWPNVVDRINPRGKNYRNPGVVIRDVCLLASSIESCATKIFESGDSPEKQERTPEEKIRVLQPLIIALSVDPERPDEVLRVMEQNRFLANLITDEKRRRIELLAVRMAVERATTFGHFDPQQIDLFFRACIKDPKLKKAPKEVGENLARERFVGTKPPMEWGLHLTARYKELLFDAMLERNGEFRREMGEQGFLWPAPH